MRVTIILLITAITFITNTNSTSTQTNQCISEYMDKSNIESVDHLVKSSNQNKTHESSCGIIYILGDDRVDIKITENNRYIVRTTGYNHLVTEAIPRIDSIIQSNKEIVYWNIVIFTGINDLVNIEKYINTYKILKDKYSLVLVSVNPTQYSNSITNITIEMLNNNLKNIDGIEYIEQYTYKYEISILDKFIIDN